jgi:hypothetical protein
MLGQAFDVQMQKLKFESLEVGKGGSPRSRFVALNCQFSSTMRATSEPSDALSQNLH